MPLSGENRFHPLINSVALGGRREGRPMSPLPSLLICILALVLCFPGLMLAIRPDRVYPESESTRVEALFGANVTLRCPFELEGADQLYSIKWHKKLNGSYVEFYSYISSPHETIHHKTLPGIRVDTEQGNQQTGKEVKLLEIELATEGTFRCEAITDDTFQVVRQKLDLVVFVPALEAPRIVASRRTYGLGERVQINCTTGPSRPIARIQWFINDIPVPESYIRRPSDEQQGSKSEKSCSGELPIEASPPQANERWTRSREINESHSVGGGLLLLTGNSSSSLEFTLREEHLSSLGHFTVRCSSLMSAQFIPEVRNSKIELGAWQANTPVIIGLQEEYQLGEWVRLNCTVPAFQKPYQNSRARQSQMEWYINGQRADRRMVIHYFTYGHIGLHFQLQSHHLADDDSLFIKCVSLQMWPADQVINQTTYIESLQGERATLRPASKQPKKKKKTRPPPGRKVNAKPVVPTEFIVLGLNSKEEAAPSTTTTGETVEIQTTTVETGTPSESVTTTETTLIIEESTSVRETTAGNNSDSLLSSLEQLREEHPQLISSLRLTLLPIAMVGALFLFV